jgi:hypothetical protein
VDACDGSRGEFRGGDNPKEGYRGETVRATLERLGKSWQRAKGWIESPDPEYARKKGIETG